MKQFRVPYEIAESEFVEKRSRFLAFAHHVGSEEEVKTLVEQYRREYYDARHVCWAYMIGTERNEYLSSDNGEPIVLDYNSMVGQSFLSLAQSVVTQTNIRNANAPKTQRVEGVK